MDMILGLAWLLAGIVIGAFVGLWLAPVRRNAKSDRAKLALADSQQRRALERLTENNRDLTTQLERAAQRQKSAVDSLKQSHAAELRTMEAELAKMRQLALSVHDEKPGGHLISGTSFAATQFDDNDLH
jgi:uncharacterized protein HemX